MGNCRDLDVLSTVGSLLAMKTLRANFTYLKFKMPNPLVFIYNSIMFLWHCKTAATGRMPEQGRLAGQRPRLYRRRHRFQHGRGASLGRHGLGITSDGHRGRLGRGGH